MLVRAVNEGRGLREELDGYALKRPDSDRSYDRDGGGRRQGSAPGGSRSGGGAGSRGRMPSQLSAARVR